MRTLLFFAFLLHSFFAQSETLSLSQARDVYLSRHPEFKALDLGISFAEADRKAGFAVVWPRVALNTRLSRGFREGLIKLGPWRSQFNLDFTMGVFKPAIWAQYALKVQEVSRAKLNKSRTKAQRVLYLYQLIAQYLGAEQSLEVLARAQRAADEFYLLTARQHRRGAVEAYELYQSQAQKSSYEFQISQTQAQRQLLQQQLHNLLYPQCGPKAPCPAREELSFAWDLQRASTQNWESQLETKVTQHWDYKAALYDQQEVEAMRKVDLREHWPQVNFSLSRMWSKFWSSGANPNWRKEYGFGFDISVPLFEGRRFSKKRRKWVLGRARAKEALDIIAVGLRGKIKELAQDLEKLQSVYSKQKSWERQSFQALKSARRSFRLGRLGYSQLVQLQAAYERAQLAGVETLKSLRLLQLNWWSLVDAQHLLKH